MGLEHLIALAVDYSESCLSRCQGCHQFGISGKKGMLVYLSASDLGQGKSYGPDLSSSQLYETCLRYITNLREGAGFLFSQ